MARAGGTQMASFDTAVVARELRAPVHELESVLHRLAMRSIGAPAHEPGQTVEQTALVGRARHLTAELHEVIDSLVGTSVDGARERRAAHEVVIVRDAIERATAGIGGLEGRALQLSCPGRLAVITQPELLRKLLRLLLEAGAKAPTATRELRVGAVRRGGEVLIWVGAVMPGAAAGKQYAAVHEVAAALGGRLDVVTHPAEEAGLRVRLPQLRAGDEA